MYTDPTGMLPCVVDPTDDKWTGKGWTDKDVKKRVDFAETYVPYSLTDTYIGAGTYVAAGIAIQCAGTNVNRSLWYSGKGIAQITEAQTFTEWGKPIYQYDWFHGCYVYEREGDAGKYILDKNGNMIQVIRGYGLKRPEDKVPLDPNNVKDAVTLMKREIQLVTSACGGKCTPTDIYIAAALAQNGPGFSYVELQNMGKFSDVEIKKKGVFRDWFTYFQTAKTVNTKTQLNRFILVVNELKSRNWLVPYIEPTVIDKLK
jgi:hypothetical protein